MLNKDIEVKIKFTSTLDRAISYVAYPKGQPVFYNILYNKQTSAIQFQVDSNADIMKKNEVSVSMYRNLETSKFCNTFFHFINQKNDSTDFRFKFAGVNKVYERDIFQFQKEKLDLNSKQNTDKHLSNNYLLVLGWKIFGLEDDFIFYFIQRKCFNKVTRTNIIRTAGLQFATKLGNERFERYHIDSQNSIKKVTDVPFLADTYEREE